MCHLGWFEPAEASVGEGACTFAVRADGKRLLRLGTRGTLAVLGFFLWAAHFRAHPAMPPFAWQNALKPFRSISVLCVAAN